MDMLKWQTGMTLLTTESQWEEPGQLCYVH